jgi:hypothetical protein
MKKICQLFGNLEATQLPPGVLCGLLHALCLYLSLKKYLCLSPIITPSGYILAECHSMYITLINKVPNGFFQNLKIPCKKTKRKKSPYF